MPVDDFNTLAQSLHDEVQRLAVEVDGLVKRLTYGDRQCLGKLLEQVWILYEDLCARADVERARCDRRRRHCNVPSDLPACVQRHWDEQQRLGRALVAMCDAYAEEESALSMRALIQMLREDMNQEDHELRSLGGARSVVIPAA